MALLVKEMIGIYQKYVIKNADPRTKNFVLCHPLMPVVLISAYLLFVKEIGPAFMKSRKPYDLKNIILIYNTVQIATNAYLFIRSLPIFLQISKTCAEVIVDYSDESLLILHIGNIYVFTKVLDLLDTVFFILRKKNNQITFLHVYHHAVMIFVGFASLRYLPGGHTGYQLVFNTLVHTAMYTYYFLTSLDETYKQSVWWKKHITQLQLVQFIICFALYMGPMVTKNCGYSKIFSLLALSQNLIMFIMFSKFYYKAYIAKKNK